MRLAVQSAVLEKRSRESSSQLSLMTVSFDASAPPGVFVVFQLELVRFVDAVLVAQHDAAPAFSAAPVCPELVCCAAGLSAFADVTHRGRGGAAGARHTLLAGPRVELHAA